MIELPEECPRGRTDCQPLAQIKADATDFICVGLNDGSTRNCESDCYRKCIRTTGHGAPYDELYDYNRRDLADECAVLAQAQAVIANIIVAQRDGEEPPIPNTWP